MVEGDIAVDPLAMGDMQEPGDELTRPRRRCKPGVRAGDLVLQDAAELCRNLPLELEHIPPADIILVTGQEAQVRGKVER